MLLTSLRDQELDRVSGPTQPWVRPRVISDVGHVIESDLLLAGGPDSWAGPWVTGRPVTRLN